ncbi:DUF1684 domain-containing protein [Gorillibacterium massiliense]|uniref:DUF1684 domain-containing protein n=1 Tax=Gorillibacterium massiliense TaxID=1280390 RepID=UPI0004B4970B|nr:DUF1684 domain-containing protein [Gorillibacterium massiliense]
MRVESAEKEAFEQWRRERQTAVAGPQGDLALIGLYAIQEPMQVEGLPGLWAPMHAGEPGLILTATAADGITVDGKTLDGTARLSIDHTLVRFSPTLTATATAQPGSDYLLALYDSQSEAIGRYEGISAYPYDPEWVIEAKWVIEPEKENRTAAFTHTSDQAGIERHHESPGDIRFVRNGTEFTLTPFSSDGALIIVFGDKTNGKITYGTGRMVVVSLTPDGRAILDFNRAFLPPCAFSYHFNCPLPPAGNRLPFDIPAGEKQVIYQG